MAFPFWGFGAGKENVTAGGGRVVSDAKGPEKQKRTRLFSSSAQIGSLLDGKKKCKKKLVCDSKYAK